MTLYIDKFCEFVDVSEFRVSNFPRFILFCGGPINRDPNGNRYSARDFILRRLTDHYPDVAYRVLLIEDMDDWFMDGHFVELLSFERHLSQLSSVIFLAAESPGSYCELGSFAVDPGILSRLMVLISEKNNLEKSYISLGPIKQLQATDERRVSVYPWRAGTGEDGIPWIISDDLEAHWKSIIEDLIRFDREVPRQTKFQIEIAGHLSLLICDLVDLFGALIVSEVEVLLRKIIGLGRFSKAEVSRHLFVLVQVELLEKVQRGHSAYFMPKSDCRFMDYAFKPDAPAGIKDRQKLKVDIRLWFKENDERRFKAIQDKLGVRE